MRATAFWAFDKFKGSSIKRNLDDIHNLMSLTYPEIQACNAKRLDKLLAHANQTVPFFKDRLRDNELSAFPVVDKWIIRSHLNDFVSVHYPLSRLNKVVTSGSTGTPFQVYHDREKRNRNTADTIFFARQAGYELGNRLFYFKIWNHVNQKSRLQQFLQNLYPVDVTSLSDEKITALISLFERDKTLKNLLGYASAFDAIVQYCERHKIAKIDTPVSSIITMSERLDPGTKERIRKLFNCEPVSRYSNVENGILAQQRADHSSEFDINFASYIVEILDTNRDARVDCGQPGRIVITDLFNYAMPMIRYDTGDIGVMSVNQTTGKPILASVEGRRMDLVYDTQKRLVSSFTITNQMWKYPEIIQYQFIQQSTKEYRFILNIEGDRFSRESELVTEFKRYFGSDANISVQFTDEIPLLASGKRKKVVNDQK